MNPGPELDRLVNTKVMRYPHGAQCMIGAVTFTPSTNIAHAWEVVEKLKTTHSIDIWTYEGEEPGYQVDITGWDIPYISEHAPTAPHAICLAALKAVGETP